MSAPLALADRIHVRGRTTDRVQNVAPMEVEHAKVDRAGPGDLTPPVVTPIQTLSLGRVDDRVDPPMMSLDVSRW